MPNPGARDNVRTAVPMCICITTTFLSPRDQLQCVSNDNSQTNLTSQSLFILVVILGLTTSCLDSWVWGLRPAGMFVSQGDRYRPALTSAV